MIPTPSATFFLLEGFGTVVVVVEGVELLDDDIVEDGRDEKVGRDGDGKRELRDLEKRKWSVSIV